MSLLDIALTSSMRTNLLSLKNTSAKVDRTQERLATGKRVNSALDSPTNFFAAKAHINRASDLAAKKDFMMEAILTGNAASTGINAIMSLINTAKGIASSAHLASVKERTTSLADQFNSTMKQINTLAGDSGYRGTNLLLNEDLTINFNEDGSSNMTINGFDATAAALGISRINQQQGSTISSGVGFSLALKTDGSVVAWGNNSNGQATVPLTAQSGVIAIAAGGIHSLALKEDGSVVGWGNPLYATVPVAAQSGVIAISVTELHSLALKSDGSVVAWGDNGLGQTSVPVSAQSDVVAIAAGQFHSLALKEDGSVVAWGSSSYGETTVPAAAQSGVVAISAGSTYSMALKDDGTVVTWGWNFAGAQDVPTSAQSGVVAISAGYYHALALKSDGSVIAWGSDFNGESVVPAEAQSGIVGITAGAGISLALKNDGTTVAWGDDTYGELTTQSTIMPPDISWASDAGIAISEKQLETAMNTLRTQSATMSSSLSVITIRKGFTDQMVATLEAGAENLTLADMNEEGANMLMLQTRQNLGVTSLSMASQSAQAVMRLF